MSKVRDLARFYYGKDFERVAEVAKPCGPFVLLRGVNEEDGNESLNQFKLHSDQGDVNEAKVHEVVAIGDGVPEGKLQVGDHVIWVSGSIDAVGPRDRRNKYAVGHHEDVQLHWGQDDALTLVGNLESELEALKREKGFS